jgi:hypothetical protein
MDGSQLLDKLVYPASLAAFAWYLNSRSRQRAEAAARRNEVVNEKLNEIHVLVNSRLGEALERIAKASREAAVADPKNLSKAVAAQMDQHAAETHPASGQKDGTSSAFDGPTPVVLPLLPPEPPKI